MPYTDEQCKLFGAKSSRGEKVPADWKQHCRKSNNPGHYVSKETFDRMHLKFAKSDHKDQ